MQCQKLLHLVAIYWGCHDRLQKSIAFVILEMDLESCPLSLPWGSSIILRFKQSWIDAQDISSRSYTKLQNCIGCQSERSEMKSQWAYSMQAALDSGFGLDQVDQALMAHCVSMVVDLSGILPAYRYCQQESRPREILRPIILQILTVPWTFLSISRTESLWSKSRFYGLKNFEDIRSLDQREILERRSIQKWPPASRRTGSPIMPRKSSENEPKCCFSDPIYGVVVL